MQLALTTFDVDITSSFWSAADQARAYQQVPAYQGTVNFEQSAYVLHETADPNVFIAEIDTVFDEANGQRTTMSLVQIFRLRDGQIAMLRDYFSELPSVASDGHSS